MTNTNDEHAALKKLRARHVGLDLDIKLLRLRLKAGFNPAQPRVPSGDPDGGQWTDGGGGAGRALADRNPNRPATSPSAAPRRSTAVAPSGKPSAGRAHIATRVGPLDSPRSSHVQHTVTLTGGRRFVFQTEGTTQTVLDGTGKPMSRAIWTRTGPTALPVVQRVSALETRDTFDAGRQLYNQLAAASTRDQRACLAFTAKDFRPSGTVIPSLSFVGMLSRSETEAVCTKLELVQKLSDEAMEEAKLAGPYSSAAVFGTVVHSKLRAKIVDLKDSTLKPEYSLLKTMEEAPLNLGAVRVDVFEDRGTGPICVYDLKTGRRGLSRARTNEFATRLARRLRPVVVIEVRPYE